jgi:hypothetical protein
MEPEGSLPLWKESVNYLYPELRPEYRDISSLRHVVGFVVWDTGECLKMRVMSTETHQLQSPLKLDVRFVFVVQAAEYWRNIFGRWCVYKQTAEGHIWIRLEKRCNEKLHDIYYLHNTKHRGGDGPQHVARTGHVKCIKKFCAANWSRPCKRLLSAQIRSSKNIIKMDVKDTEHEHVAGFVWFGITGSLEEGQTGAP